MEYMDGRILWKLCLSETFGNEYQVGSVRSVQMFKTRILQLHYTLFTVCSCILTVKMAK